MGFSLHQQQSKNNVNENHCQFSTKASLPQEGIGKTNALFPPCAAGVPMSTGADSRVIMGRLWVEDTDGRAPKCGLYFLFVAED
jgi:hypothetical protein